MIEKLSMEPEPQSHKINFVGEIELIIEQRRKINQINEYLRLKEVEGL